MTKINASDAMLKVIEDWGVKNIYGLPGGSIDSTMNALYNRSDTLNYIQVRHEEVGALAAVGGSKSNRRNRSNLWFSRARSRSLVKWII